MPCLSWPCQECDKASWVVPWNPALSRSEICSGGPCLLSVGPPSHSSELVFLFWCLQREPRVWRGEGQCVPGPSRGTGQMWGGARAGELSLTVQRTPYPLKEAGPASLHTGVGGRVWDGQRPRNSSSFSHCVVLGLRWGCLWKNYISQKPLHPGVAWWWALSPSWVGMLEINLASKPQRAPPLSPNREVWVLGAGRGTEWKEHGTLSHHLQIKHLL